MQALATERSIARFMRTRATRANVTADLASVKINKRLTRLIARVDLRHRDTGRYLLDVSALNWSLANASERREILLHELAHILDWIDRGDSDHGPRWRLLARTLGLRNPKATMRLRALTVRCACRELVIEPRTRYAMLTGWTANCPHCNKPFRLLQDAR